MATIEWRSPASEMAVKQLEVAAEQLNLDKNVIDRKFLLEHGPPRTFELSQRPMPASHRRPKVLLLNCPLDGEAYLFLPGPLSRYQMVPRINSKAIKPATTTIAIIYPSLDKDMDSARKNRAKPSPNKDNTNPPNVISLRRIPCTRTAKKRPTPSFSLISAILFLCPLSTTTIMEDYVLKRQGR